MRPVYAYKSHVTSPFQVARVVGGCRVDNAGTNTTTFEVDKCSVVQIRGSRQTPRRERTALLRETDRDSETESQDSETGIGDLGRGGHGVAPPSLLSLPHGSEEGSYLRLIDLCITQL